MGSDRFWQIWGLPKADSVPISVLENIVVPEHHAIRSTEETRRQGTSVASVEYRIRRPSDGALRWLSRHIDFVRDETGKPVRMFGVVQDITDQKEAQARHELLTHELEHRIKNILAMVSAIASQTMRDNDMPTVRRVFSERLRALANAHDLLNTTRWTKANMRQVIENTLTAFPISNIAIEGPALAINPKMALTLALAVNELATNALKYGALSVPTGHVAITWAIVPPAPGEQQVLRWSWIESSGPTVITPTRRGFGSLLVERVFGTDFGGEVRIEYPPTGVTCLMTAPVPEPSPLLTAPN
jgi:PAS domain S-box-containing protein